MMGNQANRSGPMKPQPRYHRVKGPLALRAMTALHKICLPAGHVLRHSMPRRIQRKLGLRISVAREIFFRSRQTRRQLRKSLFAV